MQICNRVRILNIPSPVPQPCCGEPSGEGSTGTFISIHTKSPWCIFQAILMNTRVGFQVVSYAYLRSGGVPTRHTHRWDGLHTRHLLESTHTNTNKRTARPDSISATTRLAFCGVSNSSCRTNQYDRTVGSIVPSRTNSHGPFSASSARCAPAIVITIKWPLVLVTIRHVGCCPPSPAACCRYRRRPQWLGTPRLSG